MQIAADPWINIGAVEKAGIPSLLISCKCDSRPEERDVDPREIELKAKHRLKHLHTLQTSAVSPETNRRGITMILRAIMSSTPGKSSETR